MRLGAFVWLLLFGLVVLGSETASAQVPSLSGTLSEIRVEGTTEYELLVKTVIRSRAGINVDSINLETERNLVYQLGTFSQVSVDLQSQPAGYVMVIKVRENPRIAEVHVVGSSFPEENWLGPLAQNFLLQPDVVLNTTRAEEARTSIQQTYRNEAGFPFDVPVVLSITPQTPETEAAPEPETPEDPENPDATKETPVPPPTTTDLTTIPEGTPVIVTYTVTENEPLREIKFEGNTILEESLLNNFFDTLKQKKEFNTQDYTTALTDISDAYRKQGYRGSGVDRQTTTLVDGVLTVRLRELKIISFDTTAIGVDQSEFSLKVGDLYNYDVLLEDIKRISQGRDTDIALEPLETSTGIRVAFRSGAPASAGEITEVKIEGNTVVPTEELSVLLKLSVGDNFTSALATEDFSEINRLYRERGYLINVNDPAKFNYLDGTYVIRISEYKITNYTVIFEQESHKTKDYVITRYLPKPGSIYNENEVREGLFTVARLGGVVPISAPPRPDPENPASQLIIDVNVREQPTAQFRPELSYTTSATSSQFVGKIGFGDTNFLGEAHDFSTEINAQTSDLGFLFGGNVSYRIPWIYNNDPYYRETPTSFAVSLFSTVQDNQRLNSDGASSVCYNFATGEIFSGCADEQKISVGDYTTRENGVSFRVGRQILPDLNLSFSARSSYSIYKLEPGKACEFNADGTLKNRNCALPYGDALEFLPQGGLSSSLGMGISFDNRDNPNFPKEGVSIDASVGLGFGNDYRKPETNAQASYAYVPLEFGVRTYVQLQDFIPGVTDPNHVFAFKVNFGHQFGGAYPRNRYFSVGDSQINDRLIRGFNSDDTNLSKTYGIGTIEYRYDFGFDSFATETIIGLVFTDVGWVSSMPGFYDYGTPIIAGAGLGVQLNLNIAGIGLPAIRLDYSFSERSPSGIFRFRFGPVF
jgi:outer membrane protein insertion porin family